MTSITEADEPEVSIFEVLARVPQVELHVLSRPLGKTAACETGALFKWDLCWIYFRVVQPYCTNRSAAAAASFGPQTGGMFAKTRGPERAGLSCHHASPPQADPTWPRQRRLRVYAGATLITACAGDRSGGGIFL